MIFLSKKELIEQEEEKREETRFSYSNLGLIIKSACIIWFLFLATYFLFSGSVWFYSIFSIIPPIAFLIISIILFIIIIFLIIKVDRNFKSGALLSIIGAILISLFFSDLFLANTQNEILDGDYVLFNFNTEFWEESGDIEDFYQFLKHQNADVYHLQEYMPGIEENDQTRTSLDLTLDRLKEKFPTYEVIQFGEFVTMSRLPVFSYEEQLDKKFLRTDIWVGNEIVSFYNVHMPVHVNTDLRPDYIYLISDMQERFEWRKVLFEQLVEELKSNTRPIVVSGDFNTTKSMRKMEMLTNFLHDSAVEANQLSVTSWEIKGLRAWRIDYVLGNDSVIFSDYKTVDSRDYSDHWAQRILFRIQSKD